MAVKRVGSKPKKSEHQKALDLAVRRAKRLEKQGFQFDYAALSRMQTKTLNKLKGYALMESRVVQGVQMKESYFDSDTKEVKERQGVKITGKEYAEFHRAHKAEAVVLAKLGKKAVPITTYYAGSQQAFNRLLEGTKKRGTVKFFKERDNRMVENFMKTLDAMKFEDGTEHGVAAAVKKKIAEMGTEWTVNKLKEAMAGELNLNYQFIFDSKAGNIAARPSHLLKAFDIPVESVQWEDEEWYDEFDDDY